MWEKIAENKRNTWILIIVFSIFVLILSWFFGIVLGSGVLGLIIGLIFLIFYTIINYFIGANIVLAISGAREVKKEEEPYLFNIIEGLSIAAGIPKPKAYIIEDEAMNAFATGRDPQHGVVVVTRGLLKRMNRQEIEGVIAHEIAHIQNYDIRLMLFAAVFVGATVLISDLLLRTIIFGGNRNRELGRAGIILIIIGIILALISPIIATIIKLAISRQREFLADATGALLTRNPEGLASALEKIGKDTNTLRTANEATAHLYFDNPLKNRGSIISFFDKMFLTHPPIEERITRLRNLTK
ncbi:MAG: zinc metalloprotease HtpX [Candidatus Diapherotrites archaeon]